MTGAAVVSVRSGIKSLLAIFFSAPWRVFVGVICLLAVDACQLAIPLVVREVIDGVAEGAVTSAWIGWMALAVVALAAGIALFRFTWRHLFFVAARRAERTLRHRIYEQALALSTREASATSTGEVMALATNDVESVRRALAMGFVAGFDATVFAVFAVAAMFWLDPATSAWIVLPLPVLAVIIRHSLRAVYERWDAVQVAFETLTERARESIAGVRVIKAYAQRAGDERRFGQASRDYFERYLHYSRVDAFFRPVILLLTGSCVVILLGLGGTRVIDGRLSVGTLVALSTYLGMLTWPMIAAGWMAALIQRAAASMDRIQSFLAKEREEPLTTAAARVGEAVLAPETTDRGAARTKRAAPETAGRVRIRGGAIEVRDLRFTYPGADRPALEHISLSVPAGSSLGIVGEIGSGKSTLGQLLGRFHEPPAGCVWIDGTDVCELDRKQLREAIAWVPQEAFLFSDTIEANLLVGDPGACAERLRQVCELAAVHDEITGFERGYQTLLGERGITLSGGQKQRLCLARALLKEAPILLLDDTLSAVDAETEQAIVASLGRAFVARTALVISHRTSAVRDLDQIVVLQRGRLIQRGTHAELIAQPGYYRRMAELQELECCA